MVHRRRLVLVVLATLLVAVPSAGASPGERPQPSWAADGPVHALARSGSTLYVGGEFALIGPRTGSVAALRATDGGRDAAALPEVSGGAVRAVVSDGGGGWWLAGEFDSVGGAPRDGVAHVLADGRLDPAVHPLIDGSVLAIAVAGSSVFIGGEFATVDGQSRARLAQLDARDGSVDGWNPGADDRVSALDVSGGSLYVGGAFTRVDGDPRGGGAAFDTATGALRTWDPQADEPIVALAAVGSTVYLGGEFTRVGGLDREHLAAVSASTGLPTTWDPGADRTVLALAVSSSAVYAGGDFASAGGASRAHVAALSRSTSLATPWSPQADEAVASLAVSGATVYAGGDFGSIGGARRLRLAALDASSGQASAWDPRADDTVSALAVSGDTVVAGGDLQGVGGSLRGGLAAVDARTGDATPFAPAVEGAIDALAVQDSTLYAGGDFRTLEAQPRENLAGFDLRTGEPTALRASADRRVRALALDGTRLYAGGDFRALEGQRRENLAAVDLASGSLAAWDPEANGPVRALALSSGTLYAGGDFHTIGGSSGRERLAALSTVTGAATPWAPAADDRVRALAVSGSTVYAGGDFEHIDSASRVHLAALDATSAALRPWSPSTDEPVLALAPFGNTVFAGGDFVSVDGVDHGGLVELDATSGAVSSWDPALDGGVRAIAPDRDIVWAGGDFTAAGDADRKSIVGYTDPPAPPTLTARPDPDAARGCSCGRVLLHVAPPPGANRVVVRQDGRLVYDGAGGDVVDPALADSTSYAYEAITLDAGGNPSAPVSASATTPDRTPPAQPGAVTGTGYPLALRWTGPAGATDYAVSRDGTTGPTSVTDSVSDPDATDTAAPGAPLGLQVEPTSRTELSVSWNAATDRGTPHRFTVVARDADGNASVPSVESVLDATSGVRGYRVILDGTPRDESGLRATLSGLTPGSSHRIAVAALDAAGNASPPSDPVEVTMPAGEAPTAGQAPTVRQAPIVAASADRTFSRPGDRVALHAAVNAGSAPVTRIHWDFGDGTDGDGADVEHVFDRAGHYTATATAVSEDGATTSAPVTLVVEARAPTLRVSVTGSVLFLRGFDGDSGISSVEVRLPGSGVFRPVPADGLRLADGRYRIQVRLTDGAGNRVIVTRTIVVDTHGPVLRARGPAATVRERVRLALRVHDRLSGVRHLRLDRRGVSSGGVHASAGAPHVLAAVDRRGNASRLSLRVERQPRLARLHPHVQLSFAAGLPTLTGFRRELLLAVAHRLTALGRLPARAARGDRYSFAMLRAVRAFQHSVGLPRRGRTGTGTIGPATRVALDRALEGRQRVWRPRS